MPRAWVGLQVLAAWLPVWAVYTALIVVVHGPMPLYGAALVAARSVMLAALLGLVVHRLARRVPWPRPFRPWFVLLHLVAAPVYAAAWIVATSVIESAMRRQLVFVVGPGIVPFGMLGIWLYAVVAGISYAIEATERAAHAEAAAARTQLAALRAQLHPHFLFNALHTVVQLIPTHPERAQEAAEQVAALLRTTVEEDRDLVTLADEWAFVSRYLDLERIRFGDRLRVHAALDASTMDVPVPSFALQALVENAVRHGAAPRVEPTDLFVTSHGARDVLTVIVRDTGDGPAATAPSASDDAARGTGLARLRERLAVLYGGASRLVVERGVTGGWSATLVIPRTAVADA